MPSSRRLQLAGLACLIALGTAGCGSGSGAPERIRAPATGLPTEMLSAGSVKVFLLTPNGPWPVWRDIERSTDPQAALDALAEGPNDTERARGLSSALPTNTRGLTATASEGRVDVDLPWKISTIDYEAVAQMTCTMAAVPGIPGDLDETEILVVFHEPYDEPNDFAVHCGADAEVKVGNDS